MKDPATIPSPNPLVSALSTGDIYGTTRTEEWFVPHKFYRFNSFRVWQETASYGSLIGMSGFEVEFISTNSTLYPGWAPIRYMFGTPKLVKDFTTVKMSVCGHSEFTSEFIFNLFPMVDDASVAGIRGRCDIFRRIALELEDSYWIRNRKYVSTTGDFNPEDPFVEFNPITSA